MKIGCPNCSFTGNIPDDKVIVPGVFATCPKCATRFELAAARTRPPRATIVCPKCAASQEESELCANCGIVFAKYAKAQELKEQAQATVSEPEPPPPPLPQASKKSCGMAGFLGFALVVIAAVWFFFTPHLAVRGMKAAAEERNAAKLSQYVNFPALKENLKASFNAKIAAETAKEKDNPFASLGAALAAAFISPLIDALVTPESLALIMKGDKPRMGKGEAETHKSDADTECSTSYESLNSFVVTIKKKKSADEPVSLVFSREGLFSSWKLTAIRFPL